MSEPTATAINRKIVLPGSAGYWDAYDKGREIEETSPGQDAVDFAYACEYNDMGPLNAQVGVVGLLMVKQGEADETDWIWLVQTSDGAHWWAIGGCDYTGWDCHSDLTWTPYGNGSEATP